MESSREKVERKKANKLIIKGLDIYFNHNSDLRFIQGLYDLQIVSEIDLFHEEPTETLKRLHKYLPEFFQVEEYEDKEDERYVNLQRLLEDRNMQISSLNQRLAAKEIEITILKAKHEKLTENYWNFMNRDRDMLEKIVGKLIDKDCAE